MTTHCTNPNMTEELNPQRTEINEYGEFGLIDYLTQNITLKDPTSKLGVGDDAAIMEYGDRQTLATTDLLLEGIHFDLSYCPLKHLGYKSAIVNFSDICAMNGRPTQLLVSIGISKRFSVEDIAELYDGMLAACEAYGVDLVGGDTSASLTGLTLSLTCIGEVEKGKAVTRSGAQKNDLICVTGDLGAAYMGLQLLEREKRIFKGEKDFSPAFEGHEYLLQRQLRPEARKDIIEQFAKKGIVPTSMMDISDGLSSEILHICKSSDCGCRIYEEKIPIDYETASLCEEMNMNLSTAALNGGEDYELLFTVPLALHERMEEWRGVKVIGYICDKSDGARLVTRDGSEIDIIAQGWNHMEKEKTDGQVAQ